MKKLIVTALLAAFLTVTGCAGNGNDDLRKDQPPTSPAADISEKNVPLASSAEDMNEVDQAVKPYLDKAFYGAILKAIGDDQTVNYSVCDADGDGSEELAIVSFFKGNTANSCMLFKNAVDYYMYYDPGIYNSDIWHNFRYDSNSDTLLWGVGSISPDDTYSRYYALNNGEWTLRSIMNGAFDENAQDEKSCILNDEYASKDEFTQYAAGLDTLSEDEDVFNINTRFELKKTASEFKKYLKVNYEPEMTGFTDKESGKTGYIITINDILLNYKCIPFIEFEKTDDISEEYIRTILNAKTICFVLDETDSGTRIRCQIFDEKIVFGKGTAGITANASGKLSKTVISPSDSGMTSDFITLE